MPARCVIPEHLSEVVPTYLENWPTALRALSIRQVDLPLSLGQARALGSNIRHFGRWFGAGPPQPLDDIAVRLGLALREFPQGAFVRLGSRSGKDCDFARASGMRVGGVRSALLMLTDGSERIAWDLRLALRHSYTPHIFVREWQEFPPWAEFRCFMRGRRLVGISQYDCVNLGACPEIAARADRIHAAISDFFAVFRTAVHVDDVVFDVLIAGDDIGYRQGTGVRLIELNPFFSRTDACLFRWDRASPGGGDFDGSFRYIPNATLDQAGVSRRDPAADGG